LVFEQESTTSEWDLVVQMCWKAFPEKNLLIRKCTVDVWRSIERFAKKRIDEDTVAHVFERTYESWSRWTDSLAKQRTFVKSIENVCDSLTSTMEDESLVHSGSQLLLNSTISECADAKRLRHELGRRERALRAWLISSVGPAQRIEMSRRRRMIHQVSSKDDFGLIYSFEHDPGATLTTGSLGIGWAPFNIFVHNVQHCEYISQEIVQGGFWEAIKTSRVLQLLRAARSDLDRSANPIFVDVGANLGWYTISAAAQGFDVVAIEPAEYNLELLRASIESNALEDYVHVFPVAVSDDVRAAKACLRVAPYGKVDSNRGNFQTTTDASSDACDNNAPLTTIDRIFSLEDGQSLAESVDIQVMKLDIEGFEARALRGAERLLRSARPPCFIILEYIPVYLEMSGVSRPTALFEELMDLGYQLYGESPTGDAKRIAYLDLKDLKGDRDYELRWPYGRCVSRSSSLEETGRLTGRSN